MAASTVRVTGYRETLATFKLFEMGAQQTVRTTLGRAAYPVIRDTQARLSHYRGVSLGTIGSHVLARGVVVRQSQGPKTGKHPNFGAIQALALRGAAFDREDETRDALEDALEKLAEGVGF